MSITYTNVHHCVHFGLLYQSTTIVVLFSPQSTIVLIHFHTPNIATTANKRTNTSCHQGGWKLGSAILNPTKLTRVNKIYRVDSMLRIICSPCYCSREPSYVPSSPPWAELIIRLIKITNHQPSKISKKIIITPPLSVRTGLV